LDGSEVLGSFVIDEKGYGVGTHPRVTREEETRPYSFYNIIYLVSNMYIEVEDPEDLEILHSSFSDVRFFSFSKFDNKDVIFVDSIVEVAKLSKADVLVLKASRRNIYRSLLLGCLLWFYSSSEYKADFSARDCWRCVAWADDIEIGLFEIINYNYILDHITLSPLGKAFMLESIVQASKMRILPGANLLLEAIRNYRINLSAEIAAKIWLVIFRDQAFKNVRYKQVGNVLLLFLSDVVAVLGKYFGKYNIKDFLWVIRLPLGMGDVSVTNNESILALKFNEFSYMEKFMRLSGLESRG